LDSAFGVRAVALLESLAKWPHSFTRFVHGVAGWAMGKIRLVWVAQMLWDSQAAAFVPGGARTSVFCRILNIYGTAHQRKLAYQSAQRKYLRNPFWKPM